VDEEELYAGGANSMNSVVHTGAAFAKKIPHKLAAWTADSKSEVSQARDSEEPNVGKLGRNDPCPCGSGKKVKKCHGVEALRTPGPVSSVPPPDLRLRLRHAGAFMSFSDAAGSPLTPDQVLQLVRRCGRQHLIRKVALLGAVLANDGVMSSRARAMTVDALARLDGGPYRAVNLAAAWVRTQPQNRVIATEKSLYLLAALALLEGAENEQDPVDGYVAFCLMALNDYASRWRTGDKLPEDERLVADLFHATRFNRGGDPLRDLVRAEMIMNTRPRRDPELRSPRRWEAFQVGAFGRPLREYFVPMAALALLSQGWGRPNRTGELNPPFIAKSAWLGRGSRHAPEGAEFVSPLVMTVDEARDVAQRSRLPDGIPFLPTEFYRKPLVELAGDVAVPYSPWALREQLHYGLWGRFRQHATATAGARGGERWLVAFGEMFERWCRRVAIFAYRSKNFRGKLLLSRTIGGPDELEDIAVSEPDAVTLFSVKAGLIPEAVGKGARSRDEVLQWLKRFLLEERRSYRGEGAFKLLDEKVNRIRAGEYEPRVARNARMYPVLVTYEFIGENAAFYRWLRKELAARGLLQQPGVASPTVTWVGTYEKLMGVAAHGESIAKMLAARERIEEGEVPLDTVISELLSDGPKGRLPQLEAMFDALVSRVRQRLFDHDPDP